MGVREAKCFHLNGNLSSQSDKGKTFQNNNFIVVSRHDGKEKSLVSVGHSVAF